MAMRGETTRGVPGPISPLAGTRTPAPASLGLNPDAVDMELSKSKVSERDVSEREVSVRSDCNALGVRGAGISRGQ